MSWGCPPDGHTEGEHCCCSWKTNTKQECICIDPNLECCFGIPYDDATHKCCVDPAGDCQDIKCLSDNAEVIPKDQECCEAPECYECCRQGQCCDCNVGLEHWCPQGSGGYYCIPCREGDEPGACCDEPWGYRDFQNTNQPVESSLDSREYIELDPALPGHIPHYNPYGDVLGGGKEGWDPVLSPWPKGKEWCEEVAEDYENCLQIKCQPGLVGDFPLCETNYDLSPGGPTYEDYDDKLRDLWIRGQCWEACQDSHDPPWNSILHSPCKILQHLQEPLPWCLLCILQNWPDGGDAFKATLRKLCCASKCKKYAAFVDECCEHWDVPAELEGSPPAWRGLPEVISDSSISEIERFLLPDGSCVDIICENCEFPRC